MIEQTIVSLGYIDDILPNSFLHFESLIQRYRTNNGSMLHTHQDQQLQQEEGCIAGSFRQLNEEDSQSDFRVPVMSWEEYKLIARTSALLMWLEDRKP